MLRHQLIKNVRSDRLRQAELRQRYQPTKIQGDNDIGKAVRAFRQHAWMRIRLDVCDIHRDSGFLCEAIRKKLRKLAVPGGINVQSRS
ncbi:hypothetical protein FHT29_006542 [Rhizobium sp. SG741]|nr:hypothetical protein [Rhizobium sp. SG741]